MLRALRCGAALTHRSAGQRNIGGAPLVLDSMIAITTVLPDGHRHPLLARVGTKLSEALAASQNREVASTAALLSPKYGHEAHVRVAHDVPLPPREEEESRQLELLAEDVRPDSRLASTIVLTPEWNGAVVAVGQLQPYKSL